MSCHVVHWFGLCVCDVCPDFATLSISVHVGLQLARCMYYSIFSNCNCNFNFILFLHGMSVPA